jgi:hypothetical protein
VRGLRNHLRKEWGIYRLSPVGMFVYVSPGKPQPAETKAKYIAYMGTDRAY